MTGQQQDAGRSGEHSMQVSKPVYMRPMPGGGSVRVELLVSDRGNVTSERLRGRVVMEAQTAVAVVARERAQATVVEEMEGDDANAVVAELVRIARDNAAIARRLLRRQLAQRAD